MHKMSPFRIQYNIYLLFVLYNVFYVSLLQALQCVDDSEEFGHVVISEWMNTVMSINQPLLRTSSHVIRGQRGGIVDIFSQLPVLIDPAIQFFKYTESLHHWNQLLMVKVISRSQFI